MIPSQGMAFAGDAVLAGPGDDLVRIFIVRFAPLMLIARPVETERAVVEQGGKTLPVLLFELGFAAVAEHEEVASEEKVVAELFHLDLHPRHGFALCVPQGNGAVALAVLFNARLRLGEDLVVGWFGFLLLGAPGGMAEQQGGGGGSRFKECSSIHPDSKQQPGSLLKPKEKAQPAKAALTKP